MEGSITRAPVTQYNSITSHINSIMVFFAVRYADTDLLQQHIHPSVRLPSDVLLGRFCFFFVVTLPARDNEIHFGYRLLRSYMAS